MKTHLFNTCSLALAISLSAFSSHATYYLTFAPAALNSSTVMASSSYYNTEPMSCSGGEETPCKIDISGYIDKAAFITHLNTLSTNEAIFEIKERTLDYKN